MMQSRLQFFVEQPGRKGNSSTFQKIEGERNIQNKGKFIVNRWDKFC